MACQVQRSSTRVLALGLCGPGDRSEQLRIAAAISVEPGVPIQLRNGGDDSLLLRLYIVEAR